MGGGLALWILTRVVSRIYTYMYAFRELQLVDRVREAVLRRFERLPGMEDVRYRPFMSMPIQMRVCCLQSCHGPIDSQSINPIQSNPNTGNTSSMSGPSPRGNGEGATA